MGGDAEWWVSGRSGHHTLNLGVKCMPSPFDAIMAFGALIWSTGTLGPARGRTGLGNPRREVAVIMTMENARCSAALMSAVLLPCSSRTDGWPRSWHGRRKARGWDPGYAARR